MPTVNRINTVMGNVLTNPLADLRVLAGFGEATVGGLLIDTGIGAPLGYPIFVHGSDVAGAGATELWTGDYTDTATVHALSHVMSVQAARDVDANLSFIDSFSPTAVTAVVPKLSGLVSRFGLFGVNTTNGTVITNTENILKIGDNVGKLGTLVENPQINITQLDEQGHFIASQINRQVKAIDIISTIKNPIAVIQQSRGRYLFLSDQAAVVVSQNGKAITTWGSENFDKNLVDILTNVERQQTLPLYYHPTP